MRQINVYVIKIILITEIQICVHNVIIQCKKLEEHVYVKNKMLIFIQIIVYIVAQKNI